MKHLAKINELFDSSSDFTIDRIEKTESSLYHAYFIYVTFNDYKYRYTM